MRCIPSPEREEDQSHVRAVSSRQEEGKPSLLIFVLSCTYVASCLKLLCSKSSPTCNDQPQCLLVTAWCHLTALCCIRTLEHLLGGGGLAPGPASGRFRRDGGSGASRRLLWGEGEQSVGQSLSCSTRAPRYNTRRGAPPPPADTAEPPLTSRPLSLKLLSPLIIT